MRVYHFLSANYGLENIIKSRLKVARLNDLNDPFEFMCVNLRDREMRDVFKQLVSDLSKTKGALCFSRSWNNPVLWSHYGDKHKGICLGFEIPDEVVIPVDYEPKRLRLNIAHDLKEGEIGENVMRRILATKFEDWRYEDEVRVFVSLNESDIKTGLHYKEFGDDLSLREVILGPRCHINVADLDSVLTKYDREVKAIPSRLAYSTFQVIERKVKVEAKRKLITKMKSKRKIS